MDVLVIGLAKPVGTDARQVIVAFGNALRGSGYTVAKPVRISASLTANSSNTMKGSPPLNMVPKADRKMTAGNKACKKDPQALAKKAIAEIRNRRSKFGGGDAQLKLAVVVSSLKRSEEVRLFREVYGDRFILVGVTCDEQSRHDTLMGQMLLEYPDGSIEDREYWVHHLISRDSKEYNKPNGQSFLDVYGMADVYLSVSATDTTDAAIDRMVNLMTGSPYISPTVHEQSMYLAHAASLRSSVVSRQVGAVILGARGDVLALGCNDVPRPGGGQYWSGDVPDARDFVRGWECNERLKYEAVVEIAESLRGHYKRKYASMSSDRLAKELLSSRELLEGSAVDSLIEFGTISHAEMSAICSAARRGLSLAGATLFCTTYPCHMCMRLIIDAGIVSVVYIHPYPKSQVGRMYSAQITHDKEVTEGRVRIIPYSGIAPRMYSRLFDGADRKGAAERDEKGSLQPWDRSKSSFRLANEGWDGGIPKREKEAARSKKPG